MAYVKPRSGTTAFLRYDAPGIGSEAFCTALLEQEGVLLVPGAAFDREGYLRMGYANDQDVLVAGLERFSAFLTHAGRPTPQKGAVPAGAGRPDVRRRRPPDPARPCSGPAAAPGWPRPQASPACPRRGTR